MTALVELSIRLLASLSLPLWNQQVVPPYMVLDTAMGATASAMDAGSVLDPGEAATATAGVADTTVGVARKQKGRGKGNHVAQDERKRRRRA